jgi:hypothetical protein
MEMVAAPLRDPATHRVRLQSGRGRQVSAFTLFRRHWHDVGLLSALVAGVYLVAAWGDLDVLQRLLLINFIVVLLHQFEEYSWPGGFPAVANLLLMPAMSSFSRWLKPLNQFSSAVANCVFAYVFYLLPVFFPHTIWLGLAPVVVGLIIQTAGHCFLINYRLRSLYSPGVATTVLGFIPVGAIYIYYIQANGLATGWDWLAALAYMTIAVLLIFYVIEQRLLGGDNPRYPFPEDELQRGGVARRFETVQRMRTERRWAG